MVRQAKSATLLVILLLGLPSSLLAQSTAQSAAQSAAQLEAQQSLNTDDVISDLLIILDSDGRSHIAQHSIVSTGPSISINLPGSVVPLDVLLSGPNREAHTARFYSDPKLLEIDEGGAFVRYQHQYGKEVEQVQPGHFVLSVQSVPPSINTSKLSQSAITWVFPSEYELVSYTVTDKNTGSWVVVSNTLTFHQLGPNSAPLSINYKHKNASELRLSPACPDDGPQNDHCADDQDEDGVPDYRDICISELGQTNNVYGCQASQSMILNAVDFTTGRTYLDVNARAALDKVANAIARMPEAFFEIGAHTDNEGAASSNLLLSKKRAAAVRHYLILKGVDPNAIKATGYGEQYPIRDNSSADGRRANRRVELVNVN